MRGTDDSMLEALGLRHWLIGDGAQVTMPRNVHAGNDVTVDVTRILQARQRMVSLHGVRYRVVASNEQKIILGATATQEVLHTQSPEVTPLQQMDDKEQARMIDQAVRDHLDEAYLDLQDCLTPELRERFEALARWATKHI